MLRNYYYLAISLPDLEIENRPIIHFETLIDQYSMNLNKEDWDLVSTVRTYFDLVNLEKSLLEEPLDHRTALNAIEIEEALRERTHFPEYVFEFLDRYLDKTDRIKNFPSLYAHFFKEFAIKNDAIAKMIEVERELRLFLLGFRSVKFQRDLASEFRYEDLSDEIVDRIISKNAKTTLLDEVKLQKLLENLDQAKNALEVRYLIAAFRFEFYKEVQDFHPFNIIGLVAYLMQLSLLEDLEVKDPKKGLEIFQYILKEKDEFRH